MLAGIKHIQCLLRMRMNRRDEVNRVILVGTENIRKISVSSLESEFLAVLIQLLAVRIADRYVLNVRMSVIDGSERSAEP
ncbi:hypothetical protein D3C71_2129380 [compost metagenome]